MEKKTLKKVLIVVGFILVISAMIWAGVIGYYIKDLPFLAILLIGGGTCAYIGSKMKVE